LELNGIHQLLVNIDDVNLLCRDINVIKNKIGEVYSLECTKVPKVFFVPQALLNVDVLLLGFSAM
jgi:hypothetical protein